MTKRQEKPVLHEAIYVGPGAWPSGVKPADEVASQTGLSEARIRELADARLIPHWRIDGGDPLFKISEVKHWIASTGLLTRCDGKPLPLSFVVTTEMPALATEIPAAIRSIAADLRVIPLANACGIYFLCLGERVIYVGQSLSTAARVSHHLSSGKVFDRAFALPCLKEHLDMLEGYFIRALQPELNGNTGPVTDEQQIAALYPRALALTAVPALTMAKVSTDLARADS